jgi:glycerophosphoryl diester phosphodiesterase
VIKLKKGWIQEAHDLGMTVNVWTVNSESSILKMKELGVDFITTDHPLEAKELLKQK